MDELPAGLVFLLVIAAILLFNYALQQAARRQQRESPPDQAIEEQEPVPEDEPLPQIWKRAAPASEAAAAPIQRPAPRAAPRGPAPRGELAATLFRTKGDLRRAIVLMTVLGPCRALDPPSARRTGGASDT
jgi:hypothetical protein